MSHCKKFTLPNGDFGILCFSSNKFNCPNCKKEYIDKDDAFLERINRNKSLITTVKCDCGVRFKLSYDIMSNLVTWM